jgi:hypothetical protein
VLPALLAAGCARGEAEAPAKVERPAALVGGRPVPREWVAAAARTDGLGLEEALARAVETAALGQFARARGFDRSASLGSDRRALLVRLLLRREVEVADPPNERDRADLRRSYEEYRGWWVRPEIRTAEHLAIVVAEAGGSPGGAGARELPADAWDIAREVVADMAPLARGAVSVEAFRGLHPVLQRRLTERWKAAGHDESRMPRVVAETIGPFDRLGPYDPAFREATFALPAPGTISAPVRTAFGWHLLYLAEVLPARDATFDDALPELLERNKVPLEAQRVQALADAARARFRAVARPELLRRTVRGADGAAQR